METLEENRLKAEQGKCNRCGKPLPRFAALGTRIVAMSVHNKLEAAKNQLDRAIKLFLDEADYYSAVMLAGAAEEILGKMLEAQGEKHALASLSSAIADIFTANDLPTLKNKELVRQLNDVRDWLKHYTDGKDIEFDAKEVQPR